MNLSEWLARQVANDYFNGGQSWEETLDPKVKNSFLELAYEIIAKLQAAGYVREVPMINKETGKKELYIKPISGEDEVK